MALTLQQFGQKVKSKYPAYNDLTDEDVANKVLAKYPQYNDMVDLHTSAPQVSTSQQPGFLDYLNPVGEHGFIKNALMPAANMASEATIKPIAKGAATVSYGALDAGIKGAQGQAINKPLNVPWLGNINPNANTPMQNVGLAGDVAMAGANVLNPYTSMVQGGLRGAAQSAAKELEYNPNTNFGNVATQAGIGGALGAITSPQALEGIGNFLKGRSSVLYDKVFKPKVNVHTGSMDEVTIGFKPDGSPIKGTVGQAAQEQGLWGTYGQMTNKTAKDQASQYAARNALYESHPNSYVRSDDILSALDDAAAKIEVPLGKQQQFSNFLDNVKADTRLQPGGAFNLQTANDLKSAMYKEVGNAYGYESSATKEIDKALARVLKDAIETQAPAVKNMNLAMGMNQEILPYLSKGVAKGSPKTWWGTSLLATTGAAPGAILGGGLGAATGAGVGAGGYLAVKALQTPFMRTLRGATQNALGDTLKSAPIQGLASMGTIGQAFSEFYRGFKEVHPQATDQEIQQTFNAIR